MLHCPKCNEENLLNAIFCRNCGAKLDIESIKPDTVMKKASSVHDKKKKIESAVYTILLIVVVAAVASVFVPKGGFSGDDLTESQMKQLTGKLARLKLGRGKELTFNLSELNAAARTMTGLKSGELAEEAEGNFPPKSVSINVKSPDVIQTSVVCMIFKKIPVSVTASGSVVEDDGTSVFKVKSASMGWLPCPGPAKSWPLKYVEAAYAEKKGFLGKVLANIGEVSVDDESTTVTLK